MKKTIFMLALAALSLAACGSPATATPAPEVTSVPVENNMPVPGMAVTEMVVEGKIPAASFESQTYINESVGFALDYPAHWIVQEATVGDRGSQTLLLSKPEIADVATVPEGETRVALMVYQWDPKNDLAAFVEARKTAWDASGFTILEEEPLTLDLGLAAVRFIVQTPDGFSVSFMFAALNDQYLSISGEGDLALVQEIMQRLRPVSQ
jgi:hypothetical protein